MGNLKSKHVDISNAPETYSSEDFVRKRRNHYKNEFIDKTILSEDESNTGKEREKKPTFLEPPQLHSEEAKEVFRQKSVRSEVDEFTYAKEVLQRRRNRSRVEAKEFNAERKQEKGHKEGKKRRKNRTEIRNRSHEPVSDGNSNEV